MARYVQVMAPRGAERRTSPRVEIQLEVGVHSESNFYTGLTQDISTGGLFVATHKVEPIGQHMLVQLTLPGVPQPITVECEVRWVREATALHGNHSHPGMGLRFITLSANARQAIAGFLRTRESLFYDDE